VPVFVGIDGGGSKTTCLVGDEISVMGRASTGPSNPIRVGEEIARQNLHGSIRQACEAVGVRPAEVTRACVGIAGGGRPATASQVRKILDELIASTEVVGDMQIALEAAFPGKAGLVVIAGSGSIAFGRNESGKTVRAGGWGFAVSDEGSGHWIGRSAVGAIMRAQDSQQSTVLTSKVLETTKLADLDQLVQLANATPPPDFAQLFSVVVSAANAGDQAAQMVLKQAASELVQLAQIAAARLWEGNQTFALALSGGVFKHSSVVRKQFEKEIVALSPGAILAGIVEEPAMGALYLARRVAAHRTNVAGKSPT
jgi:glucosamine kinase